MSTQVQRRKGTTAQHASFTGASAELTVDTTKNTVVVHDGATAGGIPLAKETGSALSVTSLTSSGAAVIETTDNTNAALRITQLGTGNALLIEDSASPDATPTAIDNSGRVAIGYTTTVTGLGPSTAYRPSLQVHGTANNTSSAGVYNWSSTPALTSAVTFNRSLSNTIGTFAGAVTTGTSLGVLSFSGDDSTSFYEAVRIQAQADGNASAGSMPGRMLFSTTPAGSTTPVERMRIASNGDVSLAGGTANGVPYLNGSKVITTGTALTFDGTNLGVGAASPFGKLNITNGAGKGFEFWPEIAASTNAVFNYDRTGGTYQDFQVRAATHQWLIGSAEKMRLDASGNFGIGTTSPARKLDVNGPVRIADANVIEWGGTSTALVGSSSSNTMQFFTSSTEKMRLDGSGNLGIGTTANASAILDAQSTTKGVRMPNMTTTQKNAISSPAAGLMVFDTTLAKLCVYSGSAWQTITSL